MSPTAVQKFLVLSSLLLLCCKASTAVENHASYTPTLLHSSNVFSAYKYPFKIQWSSLYADVSKKHLHFTGTLCLEYCKNTEFIAFNMALHTMQIENVTSIPTNGRRPYAQGKAKYTPVVNAKYVYLVGQDSYYIYYQNIFVMNRNSSSIGNYTDYFAIDVYNTAATVTTEPDSAVVIICTTNLMMKYKCKDDKCVKSNEVHLGSAPSRPQLLVSGSKDMVAITRHYEKFFVVPVDLESGFLSRDNPFEFKAEHLKQTTYIRPVAAILSNDSLYVIFEDSQYEFYERDAEHRTGTIVKLTLGGDGKTYQFMHSKLFEYEGMISAYTHNETHLFVGTTYGCIGYINLKRLFYDKNAIKIRQLVRMPFSTMVLVDDILVATLEENGVVIKLNVTSFQSFVPPLTLVIFDIIIYAIMIVIFGVLGISLFYARYY